MQGIIPLNNFKVMLSILAPLPLIVGFSCDWKQILFFDCFEIKYPTIVWEEWSYIVWLVPFTTRSFIIAHIEQLMLRETHNISKVNIYVFWISIEDTFWHNLKLKSLFMSTVAVWLLPIPIYIDPFDANQVLLQMLPQDLNLFG